MAECIFCAIVAGEIPSQIVRRDDRTVAFRDLNPQAPTHVLVIPVEHVRDVSTLEDRHAGLLDALYGAAREVARAEGIAESGYRVVANVGPDAGQSVFHLHLHVLGGRTMGWPPG